jgi:hypothetical protein
VDRRQDRKRGPGPRSASRLSTEAVQAGSPDSMAMTCTFGTAPKILMVSSLSMPPIDIRCNLWPACGEIKADPSKRQRDIRHRCLLVLTELDQLGSAITGYEYEAVFPVPVLLKPKKPAAQPKLVRPF